MLNMPPEWHPHTCCWMGWPQRTESWPLGLAPAKASWAAVVKAIAQFEPVKVIAKSTQIPEVKHVCGSQIKVVDLPNDDIWLRDTGPTFVINGQGKLAGINWKFNAWGENRENLSDYQEDARLAERLLEYLQIPRYAADFILEGGSIHVDGEGSLLTTEECLLNPNRNPHLSRQELEKLLGHWLGISKVIWLGQGLQDDETAGHIDNLACFIRPGVVLALTSKDSQDSNYPALQDNLQRLRQAKDAQGRNLEIVEIEQPERRDDHHGRRLSLSYLNFYLANGGLVMPVFGDPADPAAITTLTRVFPKYQIVPINILDLVHGGGGIHCVTQQQPAVG